jgi:hypothetical protein
MGRLLTTEEAAAPRTPWSKSTLEKKRLTGDGPPYLKVGRNVRYDEDVLDQWLIKHLITSTSETVDA